MGAVKEMYVNQYPIDNVLPGEVFGEEYEAWESEYDHNEYVEGEY